ncbi:class I SAM-dependent methyltransferase [Cytobacillus sp. FSL K6-0265]|uniref:class I SAM-dependent methyltransferase n=1 Tax=Cytobacillus sp. FSL K6-0265 TaxID=2921448 RepID=UPI0030FA07B6
MKNSYEDALAYFQVPFAHPGGKQLTSELFINEDITSETTILDAGCGTGSTSYLLSDLYHAKIEAIDKHSEMVQAATRRARKLAKPFRVSLGNVEKLSFSNQQFDFILSESVTAFTNVENTLKEFARVLKGKGKLYLIEMTKEASLTSEMEDEMKGFYQLEKVLSEKDWASALDRAGFKKVEVLKASTIAEMIAEGVKMGDDSSHQHIKLLNEDLSQVLIDHYQLNLQLSNHLGYRVIRAMKNDAHS